MVASACTVTNNIAQATHTDQVQSLEILVEMPKPTKASQLGKGRPKSTARFWLPHFSGAFCALCSLKDIQLSSASKWCSTQC